MSKGNEDRLLYRSAWPLVCGWYAVKVRCLTPRLVHWFAENSLVNCAPLSIKRYARVPYGTSNCSKKRFTMCVEVVLGVGIARVNLE